MKNPLKRITIVFILVALLPVGFIVYELGSLNENEKIVREIYENQLDAILYSINQYSDDVINSWAHRFTMALAEEGTSKDSLTGIKSALDQLSSMQYIYFTDRIHESVVYHSTDSHRQSPSVKNTLDNIVQANGDRIDKLIAYEKAGFQKMEVIDTAQIDKVVTVFFVINEGNDRYRLGAMGIDLPSFIKNTLGPKMQTISQEKFIIAAFKSLNDSLVYSTSSVNEIQTGKMPGGKGLITNESQKKSFWLLPGYFLTISLTGVTLNDLVRDRMMTSLIILALLMFTLILGIIFLYRNIRHEISLAQAKSEFVSNVSHEIRTPLALMSMYAETLEMDRVSEEKKKEYHQVIAKETARLSSIVNRILDFSQVQAGKRKYEAKPIQLNELVSDVLQSYLYHLKDKGFVCEFLRDENIKTIWGDPESIVEAFINLLDNAIKYSHEKKQITIKTGVDERYTFVEVKDEGIGIVKTHQQDIFEPFYRAPTGDVHNTKGSGLGLTLVKKTMDVHHGKIKVESAPGKGSTFRLYFPHKNEKRS